MVPFWRRRLLAVTMPAVIAGSVMLVGGLSYTIEQLRTGTVMQGASIFEPHWLQTMIAAAIASVFPMCTALALGSWAPKNRLGPGYWLSTVASTCRFLLVLLAMMATMDAILDPDPTLSSTLILLLSPIVVLLFAISIPIGTGKVRPREKAVMTTDVRYTITCVILIAGTAPLAIAYWHTSTDNYNYLHMDFEFLTISIMCSIMIIGLQGSLVSAWLCRQLTIRHAHYHATHCHDCGYDLTTLEADACPECGLSIQPDQRDAIESLAASTSGSNGSQSASSSPTRSSSA
ncbi:MAG: hypothetical protein AAGH71_03175 [Planctomycetota bacterium]